MTDTAMTENAMTPFEDLILASRHFSQHTKDLGIDTDAKDKWQRIVTSQLEYDETQVESSEHKAFELWFAEALKKQANLADELAMILIASQFVVDYWAKKPELLRAQIDSGELWLNDVNHEVNLQNALPDTPDDSSLASVLRQYRQRQMCRIIFRDANRLADMNGTTRDVSLLAEASIDTALNVLHPILCGELGTPMSKPQSLSKATDNQEPVEQRMIVLGMGKLGAYELNLSSDIDLIFSYPEGGETVGGRRTIANQQFFLKLGQRLIKALDAMTIDGFVFRVDMRLRPYGQSGALALSFDAMEEYYQDQGREWERYAMIKARVVGGDREQGEHLMAMLRPFTYRRYIDFSAIESLRSMKQMINREVVRKGKQQDVKLGLGGIREIEFIGQAFQLIRGGRETELQDRRIQVILRLLAEKEYLPSDAVDALLKAYVFLRNVEHAIQGWQDRQTQLLPDAPAELLRIAVSMEFETSDAFMAELTQHQEQVHHHFNQVIATEDEDAQEEADAGLVWWEDDWDQATLAAYLSELDFEDSEDSARRLISLRDSAQVRAMQKEGVERLIRFLPILLSAMTTDESRIEYKSRTLSRVLQLVESVLRRTAYLMLLIENPQALKQVLILCESSPWIAEQLARHPVLLDELLNGSHFCEMPDRSVLHAELRSELQQNVLRLTWDDLEGHMDALRYFKKANALRIAAAEITGMLPLMKVSDYLTALAEVILEHVLALAWHQMIPRHGQPLSQNEAGEPDFIIVGYGKSGGIELGHGSDLDLVFIHDAPSGYTDGDKPLDNKVFFARLGQKMIHILNTQTAMGQLYEVDMRLRPSGNSGLLVSSVKAYEDYLLNEAWTWEQQALVRARVLAGNIQMAQKFADIRHRVLSQKRDTAQLKIDVGSMRGKMIDHLAPGSAKATDKSVVSNKTKGQSGFAEGLKSQEVAEGQFHIKHSQGGIVDIEFMVQYAVLAWSYEHPELTEYTDNIRILEGLAKSGLITPETEQALKEAYILYRSHIHRLALQRQSSEIDGNAFLAEREQVIQTWQALMN